MMNKIEENLIACVSERPELFDTTNEIYMNNKYKDLLWEEIACTLKTNAHTCKKKWKNIRDAYRKYLKDSSLNTSKNVRPYKYSVQLAFLKPYLQDRDTMSNVLINGEFSQEDLPSDYVTCEMEDTQSSNNVTTEIESESDTFTNQTEYVRLAKKRVFSETELLISYIHDQEENKRRRDAEENDALKQLFLSMYNSVKNFPPKLRAETKIRLFQIISEAELSLIEPKE